MTRSNVQLRDDKRTNLFFRHGRLAPQEITVSQRRSSKCARHGLRVHGKHDRQVLERHFGQLGSRAFDDALVVVRQALTGRHLNIAETALDQAAADVVDLGFATRDAERFRV